MVMFRECSAGWVVDSSSLCRRVAVIGQCLAHLKHGREDIDVQILEQARHMVDADKGILVLGTVLC